MWRYVWNLRWLCMPASTSLSTPPPPNIHTQRPISPSGLPSSGPPSASSQHSIKLPPCPQQSQHIDRRQLLVLFLAGRHPTSCLCALFFFFFFFAHPVACGWKCSLINSMSRPIIEARRRHSVSFYLLKE